MTQEPMPEVPARERDFHDGARGMLMHVNFGPLPENPAEQAIERARRAAIRAETSANIEAIHKHNAAWHDEIGAMDGIWAGWFRFVEMAFGYEYVRERRLRQANEVRRRRAEVGE